MTKVFYIKTDTLYIGYHQYNVYPLFLGSITNFFLLEFLEYDSLLITVI